MYMLNLKCSMKQLPSYVYTVYQVVDTEKLRKIHRNRKGTKSIHVETKQTSKKRWSLYVSLRAFPYPSLDKFTYSHQQTSCGWICFPVAWAYTYIRIFILHNNNIYDMFISAWLISLGIGRCGWFVCPLSYLPFCQSNWYGDTKNSNNCGFWDDFL